MLNKGDYIKKSVFLETLEECYKDCSTEYLMHLRDAFSIIIKQRTVGGCKPYSRYEGFMRFQ